MTQAEVENYVNIETQKVAMWVSNKIMFNPLNTNLNPICHLLALLGPHPIFHIRRIMFNDQKSKRMMITRRKLKNKWYFKIYLKNKKLQEDTINYSVLTLCYNQV
jgi:hypothetical protein